MTEIETLAQQIAQAGRDEMARALANLIDMPDGAAGGRGGRADTLVHAGATDPR